jgi:hypothetical protein
VPWGLSARWVTKVEAGFFTVHLRPTKDWVNGRPTFDAFNADLEPYPHGLFFQHGLMGSGAILRGPSLTADEYLDLYGALPDQTHPPGRSMEAALEKLDAWQREHREAAQKYPAHDILRMARMTLRRTQ